MNFPPSARLASIMALAGVLGLTGCGGGDGSPNVAPVAQAGLSQTATVGTSVALDGRASSDANGDTLSFEWSWVARPSGSAAALLNGSSALPSFVPDVVGDYVLGLRVSDGSLQSSIVTVVVSAVPAALPSQVPAGYALVWSDEFNTSAPQLPDGAKWGYDTFRNPVGWFNNERQYYASARLQNSVVQDGKLIITARKESLAGLVSDWGGQAYTSARLITKGRANWTYGFFEIRAKLPCGAGTWPAIWTLGSSTETWPDQGEIDIMEQTGWDKGTVLGTVHTLAGSGGAGSTGSTKLADACTAFHNYQIKWTVNAIEWFVDGVSYRSVYNNPTPGSSGRGWPFNKPQYLLINLAVGGVLGGTVNDATLSSTSLEIDHVRVYQAAP